MLVQVPYQPRPQQREFSRRFRKARFGVLVCHRRFGKSVLGVNLLQQGATMSPKERPRYAFIGPTFRQGKAVAWDYMRYYAKDIPGARVNHSELRIDFAHNGGQVRIYGTDNPDSLRGIYLDGCVLDEFGMHPAKTYSEVIAPLLVDRGGWALFDGTPNGRNQFYDMAQYAKAQEADGNATWVYGEYRASQTGLLDPAFLADARATMTEDEYQQEFECNFSVSVRGAIYAKEMALAQDEGRITNVPYDALLPVHTAWDLGVGDHTAIWFWQALRGGEVRLVDYYEASGEGLPHYVGVLQRKPYVYGRHWAPPDIRVRELGSGKSRLETAASLGLKFEVVRDIGLEDGISAARMLLPRCWFDQTKARAGIDALQSYRRDYSQKLDEFKSSPVHDHASHGADAFRYLCVAHQPPVDTKKGQHPFGGHQPPREGAWMS